jgi:hypothetical protein
MLGKDQRGAIYFTRMLFQESKTRDELIGLLFNLTKRPEAEARRRILAGLAWLCCQPGWTGHRVEEEILPHLWSQLEHKVRQHTEKEKKTFLLIKVHFAFRSITFTRLLEMLFACCIVDFYSLLMIPVL